MSAAKPLLHLVRAEIAARGGETRLERAQRLYGRQFGREIWPCGEGARYWTPERIFRLAAENAALRQKRGAK